MNQEPTTEHISSTQENRATHDDSASKKVPRYIFAQRIVYYIGGVILSLLAIRFLLALLGAAEGNPFVDFIYTLSSVFVSPFYGIFGEPTYGQSQFETSTLVAMAVFGLLTVGVAKIFTLNRARDEV